ncbi:MAG: hypothetical protein K6E21_03510 [Bacilli bacterium]|nr:hypothetical protein [Bacilli bacterium]
MTDFNNSFDMNGWGIFDWDRFPGMIGSLILNLIQWLCLFVYFLESIFWALVRGIKVGETRDKTPIYKNLLDAILFDGDKIFDFKNNVIGSLMILFIIIGLVLIVLMSVIAIFKSHLSTKEEDKNPKNVVLGGIKAVILMVLFPVIIYCVLKVTNSLVDAVCIYNKFDTDVKTSLANKIFFMFANSSGNTTNWYDSNGKPLFSFMLGEKELLRYGGEKDTLWQILNSDSLRFVGNDTANIGNYDYLFAILVLIVLMIGLFKAIMLLGKRIFDVIVLYIIAPFPIACVPNDDGKRFEIWKDTIVSKILASFGIAVAFAIYLVVITELGDLFASISSDFKTLTLTVDDNGTFNTGSILTIVYVLILVSGGLAIPAMYTMLATLVSQNAGQLAQSDLQNANADMAFMQRGAHAIGAGALFAADKTGVLGLAKNVLMGKANPQNGQSNVSNALASASGALGRSSGGGALGSASNGSRGKLSAVGQVTGLNQGLAGVGKKVLKGGLTVGALGLTGMGLAPALAIAGGIGMAQSGGFLGAKTAFNKIKDKKLTAQQQQKENQIAEKVNEALQNYGDKKKLGLINKDIQKLGGKPVDSAFVLNKLQQDKDEKKASAIAKDLHVDIPHPEVKTKETPNSADDKSLDGFKIPTKK